MATEVTIDEQHQLRSRERADHENHQPPHREIKPGEKRHLSERHSLAPQADNSRNYVGRCSDTPNPGHQQGQCPVVCAVSRGKCLCSQGSVSEPPNVRSIACAVKAIAAHKAEIEEQPAEGRHPEAEGVQAWEGHITRANHQGKQVIRKSKYERHGHEENHGRSMHGEHPVEHLRGDEVVERTDELDPHDRRLNSPDNEHHQRIKDVKQADPFVIDRGHPLVKLLHKREPRRVRSRKGNGLGRHQRRVSIYWVSASSSGSLNPMAGILEPRLMASGF